MHFILAYTCLGLEDSLSGSASSSDDSDESDDDAVSALVRKAKRLNTIREDGGEDEDVARNIPNAPVLWFHSPPATQLGIYKVIFPVDLIAYRGEDAGQRYLEELKQMQAGGGEEGRKWALFMVAGGHFAGAVVHVSRPEGEEDDVGVTKKGKPKKPKPDTEVLKHKTFHRYTSKSYLCSYNCVSLKAFGKPVGSKVVPKAPTIIRKARQSVQAPCFGDMVNKPCETLVSKPVPSYELG